MRFDDTTEASRTFAQWLRAFGGRFRILAEVIEYLLSFALTLKPPTTQTSSLCHWKRVGKERQLSEGGMAGGSER